MDYKKIEVREIDGYKVTSRTLNLSDEEAQKKFSEIKAFLSRKPVEHQNDKTA